jgi:hypothetical protein
MLPTLFSSIMQHNLKSSQHMLKIFGALSYIFVPTDQKISTLVDLEKPAGFN